MDALVADPVGAFSFVTRFRALNTDVEVSVIDPSHSDRLVLVERVFGDIERRFSRFLTSSELSQLNVSGGSPVPVSRDLIDLLERSLHLHCLTDGVFDPAIIGDLESAGYDQSFEHVAAATDHAAARAPNHRSIAAMRVDVRSSTVTLPAGLRLDLGGIGKGYAVECAADVLRPASDFLINAGGDIYASGCGVDGERWLASVVHPVTGREASTVRLRDQGLATSTTAIRRWTRGGREMHHIIDPRTGEPARSDVMSASVIAPSVVEADVFAKAALILGSRDGLRFVERQECAALLVRTDGCIVTSERWPKNYEEAEV
jgi:thiamine biosynthesis lipoprotein